MDFKSYLSFLAIVMAAVFLAMFITDNPAGGLTNSWKVVLSIALGIVGFIYFYLRKHAPKKLLGAFSILVGAISNWFSLTKVSQTENVQDRLFFLAAGIAVMAQGYKEIADGDR